MLERSPHHQTAHEILGYGFPLTPDKRNPPGTEGHRIYWNAFIWDENGLHCWGGGDLDLTDRAKDLQALADTIGTIYVTPEQPWNREGFEQLRHRPEYAGEIVTFSPTTAAASRARLGTEPISEELFGELFGDLPSEPY